MADVDMNAELPLFGAEKHRAMADGPEYFVPMTLAHLVAVLRALSPEQQEAVWCAASPPVRMLANDYTDAEADRILMMSDEELDAEIRAAGEDPESVRRWSKATGRWCTLLAQSTARMAEEKGRADSAERELARARADSRALNERLFVALKEVGAAGADAAFAVQSLAAFREGNAPEEALLKEKERAEAAEQALAESERQRLGLLHKREVAIGDLEGERADHAKTREELARAQERHATLEAVKKTLGVSHDENVVSQAEVLIDEETRLAKELRGERERVAQAIAVLRLGHLGHVHEALALLQPPTASAREGEEKPAHSVEPHDGAFIGRCSCGFSCRCPSHGEALFGLELHASGKGEGVAPCWLSTGKKPSVETIAAVAASLPISEEDERLVDELVAKKAAERKETPMHASVTQQPPPSVVQTSETPREQSQQPGAQAVPVVSAQPAPDGACLTCEAAGKASCNCPRPRPGGVEP